MPQNPHDRFEVLMTKKHAIDQRLEAQGVKKFGHHQCPTEALCVPNHGGADKFLDILEISLERLDAELVLLENDPVP